MNKFISILLTILILLSSCLVVVSAMEIAESEVGKPLSDQELDSLAAEVFPEYAEKILSPQMPVSMYSLSENQIIVDETREISDTERMTYQEYADGRASIVYITDTYVDSTSTSGSSTTYVVDIQVRHLYIPGSLYVADFSYTIVQNGYDRRNNTGTSLSTIDSVYYVAGQTNETADGPAKILYYGVFTMNTGGDFLEGASVACALEILVGDDTLTCNAY